jgi:hypothetical protein
LYQEGDESLPEPADEEYEGGSADGDNNIGSGGGLFTMRKKRKI